MTKQFYILVTFATLLLTGCAKEPAVTPETGQENRTELTFTYKNYQTSSGTRATVPAETAEKVIRDMSVFAFHADGSLLRELVKDADYTETVQGENSVITMSDVFLAENLTKTLSFWFVANNAASTGGMHIASFNGTDVDFAELLTTELADGIQTDKAETVIIADGTGGLLMTGKSDAITILGKRSATVSLKRRVARFDIDNPKTAEYRINTIFVTNAKMQAQMFADAIDMPSIAVRSLDPIAGPSSTDYIGTLAKCVFYLYPTDLATTTITMEVEYIGPNPGPDTKMLFTLDVAETEIITANKRYTLKLDPASMDFGLGAGDWDDGEI